MRYDIYTPYTEIRGRISNLRNCEQLKVPQFNAKFAFVNELSNHSIVEMLCPLRRPRK